ncbi:hypothetical protein AB9E14_36000 [Rhizobium leguminosarum]|jgi:hypothetical protein|nr:hypothetical protein [Rhizobium leguminosarum]MDV4166379.1 hypothetical protein [Rhizobium leguminosarum]MDV4176809.1 hypothetical protein [Rhizobium leguminosarum]WSH74988.1 hypothetical protein U8Q02_27645 [Rhizobium leguminosarum]
MSSTGLDLFFDQWRIDEGSAVDLAGLTSKRRTWNFSSTLDG